MHSEEGKGMVTTPLDSERNSETRMRMSQVSRSTRGLVEHHCTNRQNHTHLPQQWGGKQTKYNTLRKLNAMLQYEVTLEGTGTMLSSLRGAPPEIMRQPGEATRERTTKERMGSTTKTRRGKIEDGEIPHDDPTEPLKGPRTKTAVPKTEPEKLDFTTCLTLFRHFTNLTMLKSEDGKTAVSMKQRGTRCKGQTLQKHKKAIKTGMHHLYPYICEKVPPDIKGAKKFCKQESSRVLKPEYKTLQHTGPIDEHTRKTRLPNEQPETLREILDDWRSAGVTEKEIRNRFSLHPLTRDLATQGRDEEQEEGEKVTEEGRRAARDSRWSMEADEKKEQATIHLAQPGRPDYPVRYHATRQYAIDPNDPTTQVTQYHTEGANKDGSSSTTWSEQRILERYLRKAKRRRCPCGTHVSLKQELLARQRGPKAPAGHKERLSGRPTGGIVPWPKRTNLTLDSSETNPE
ncbi:hypothetical protein CYMTET_39672 [Cymbomonas tetramitiformis]|uniref:Uncharacterized protein n=1 Tax=Cymbomonas tetramitiformis TaxID=36881 RepID=A0AAE0CBN8_9CHLO|nr:hypothetical protein CYMTET_39672 [Cymbomonas tetramitiformis]